MNKNECKKYVKRAYKNIVIFNKEVTIENLEIEMKKAINEQSEEYIAYSKIALNNMKNSGNIRITLKDLLDEIDVIPTLYKKVSAIEIANKL